MLHKLFGFDSTTMTVRKEVIGGITTFLTMAYLLAVIPSVLADTGMDSGAVFTATVTSSVIAILVMAIYAKLPFALAPGLGLNAFFAYSVVITMGYTWQFALTAVFIEGILFILLTVSGLRQKIVESMPLHPAAFHISRYRPFHRFHRFEECRHRNSQRSDICHGR